MKLRVWKAAHTAVLYDISAGMPFSESNAVAQTSDGFLYVGCYGGLLRYDGRSFSQVDGVTNVVGLCADSRGRLWIAANGASCLENGTMTTYTTGDGLPSNTLRDITEDAAGNIYFATTAGLAVLDGTGTIESLEDARLRNAHVEDVAAEGGRTVYGCTKDGAAFAVEGLRVTGYRNTEKLGAGVACVYPDPDRAGQAYFGTTGSEILHGSLDEPSGEMERVAVPRLRTFNALTCANGYLWACADNSIAYIDGAGTARLLRYAPMTGMVSDVLCDHEGNLWFASARQGVMKLAESLFTDISGGVQFFRDGALAGTLDEKSGMKNTVILSLCEDDGGTLYLGSDGDHLALVVADVSGKGVPAALFMMISKTLVKNTAEQGLSPARVMREVNARLLAAAAAARSLDPEALLAHIRSRVDGFVKGAPQFDDITMLAIRINDETEKTIKMIRGASE